MRKYKPPFRRATEAEKEAALSLPLRKWYHTWPPKSFTKDWGGKSGMGGGGGGGGGGGYHGPADVAPTPTIGWWGVRAMSAATQNGLCAQARRFDNSSLKDFNLVGSDFDNAGWQAFAAGSFSRFRRLYDQSGNNNFAEQNNTSFDADYTVNPLAGLSNAVPPTVSYDGASSRRLDIHNGSPGAPVSLFAVINVQTSGTRFCGIFGSGFSQSSILEFRVDSGNTLTLLKNSVAGLVSTTATISDLTWHTVGATYDGATAQIYIDGSLSASASASQTLNVGQSWTIGEGNNGEFYNRWIPECGAWSSILSAGNFSALHNNSKNYFGF